MLLIVFRDINKTVKSQAVESAKAEERLLNMDFVMAKAKELGNRRERAEVRCGDMPVVLIHGEIYQGVKNAQIFTSAPFLLHHV